MILLDTNAFLFDALAPSRLTAQASAAIIQAFLANQLCVLDVTLTEVAWLAQAGRIELHGNTAEFLETAVQARNIVVLAVTPAIATLAAGLAMHKDPADRLIAAAAMTHRARLVTSDERLRAVAGLVAVW